MTAEPQTADSPSPEGPPTRRPSIDEHKAWLVEQGDEIGKLARSKKYWKNQVRVLQEAAHVETEPTVMLNLLRYQAARNDEWRDPPDVAEPLEKRFEECIQRADKKPALAMELMRHLLLYTVRAYTYQNMLHKEEQDGKGKKGGRS